MEIVLVHDGARPFIIQEHIHRLVYTAQRTVQAIIGVPVKDTVKTSEDDNVVIETVERSSLWADSNSTSFSFFYSFLGHEQAEEEDFIGTDDASLVEKIASIPVTMIEGDYDNIKLTTPEDLLFCRGDI